MAEVFLEERCGFLGWSLKFLAVRVGPLPFVNLGWALPTEPAGPWVHAGSQQ